MQKRFLIWENPRDAIVSLVLFLMLLGCVNVFSASFVTAADMFGNGYHYLIRYAAYGAVGLAFMYWLGWKTDYHNFFNYNSQIYAIFLAILIGVDVFGKTTKGAQRWVTMGSISFQPSEFVKLAVIIMGAGYLGHLMVKGKKPRLMDLGSNLAFWATAVLAALVLLQPDMGTAAIIMALITVLYIVAGLDLREIGILGGAGLVVSIAAILQAPYRMNRVRLWIDPYLDPQGNGYQAVQSFVAIGSGRLIGSHFGMGFGKFFYLPEAHTDFAFAIFCQEWGFLGALFLIFSFILLAFAPYRVGQHTQDRAGFLLVTGVNFLVVGQAFANLAMVCGLLPVIGVPLTFISYGGTSLVASLMGIGLVLSVYRAEVQRERGKLAPDMPRSTQRPRFGTRPGARRWRP